MPELMEKFQNPEGHDSDKCPFCPIKKKYQSPKSIVSDENSSKDLGDNLEATEKDDNKASFHINDIMAKTEGIHGQYTVQAHHLICGNEILRDQKIIQSWLCKQGRHEGKLKPCDTGYNVNNAENGIWLPSTPAQYKTAIKLETALERITGPGSYRPVELKEMAMFAKQWPEFMRQHGPLLQMLGVNTEKSWTDLTDEERDDIAFVVMQKQERQFHLSSHGGAVPDDQAEASYVKKGIKHLGTLSIYMRHYSKECPMDNGAKRSAPPYVPPFKLNEYLDTLSMQMRSYVIGHPKTWKYFISNWAFRLTQKLKSPASS